MTVKQIRSATSKFAFDSQRCRISSEQLQGFRKTKQPLKYATTVAENATIGKTYKLLLSRTEFIEALYPVTDLQALNAYKAPLVKWPRALLYPVLVTALAFTAANVLHLSGNLATLLGLVAGCMSTAHIRSRRDVAVASALARRRYRQSALGYGDYVQIDDGGIRFLHNAHGRLVKFFPWDTVRSFAISQDSVVIRTSSTSQGPIVLSLGMYTKEEQIQIFLRLTELAGH